MNKNKISAEPVAETTEQPSPFAVTGGIRMDVSKEAEDLVARQLIERLTNDVELLGERLKWLEANAVISTSRRKIFRSI